ncbi:MAG: BMC domain-containing protein [Candidatus Hydrogenedentota bacterium]|jgi:microcompartment protein CcmL/EutN|uniref:Ethanolamine utilization protein similar to PduA/PduJ n=1 Tax=Sumerlaea chitinivorans TaxID=2250252 RepID=A0A2Z4Y1E7_SUMC1|nr:Ethanolamine utilization protein similar to PduA/PduJ [Candidatus Sumerlaea chitinivorans]MCX7962910.1 BMC domain-containing protein [Candidatus Sumerlaea chitinivorans]RMH26394.1 MAG: BMC domain-containing protein [Candidatus Hydrogenedentota bacterium]GIX44802.1 MAG: propanediol utilization: polyhedral bodies pduT [Candidatus Sumerlaea sp.]
MADAVGMVEVSSVAMGYEVEDAMLKAAEVQLLVARTICSGKFLVAVGGKVADVMSSVNAGVDVAREGIIDHIVIPNIHPAVLPAITGSVDLKPEEARALGIIETFSAATAVEAADAAVKAGSVTLFRVHLAMALGGKGFVLVTGDVSACRAAVDAGAAVAAEHGLLVNRVVIPGPRRELFREYI